MEIFKCCIFVSFSLIFVCFSCHITAGSLGSANAGNDSGIQLEFAVFDIFGVFHLVTIIDTIDWKEERSAQTILDTVLPKLHDGCIILCHNNGFKIKEYLPALIEAAQSQGYEFVTVSELRLSGDTIIDVNGVQKAA